MIVACYKSLEIGRNTILGQTSPDVFFYSKGGAYE